MSVRHCVWGMLLGWLVAAAGAAPLAKFEPATGCYLGAFIERDANALGDFALFEKLTGKHHACYVTYSGYGRPFPTEWVKRVGAHGSAAHIGWEPNSGLDVVQDDSYLRGWARAARATGVPIFLRFASEMNGNWMPYSGNPAKFIARWRTVAEVMHREAPNVAMVWCVFSSPESTIPMYYPGDEYVDWVGVNVYSLLYHNNDMTQPAMYKDPRDDLKYVYNLYADRKPVMICEYAASSWCRVIGQQTVNFALEKMATLYQNLPSQFPRIKAVNWFSMDAVSAGLADNDYSLTHDPRLLDRYRLLTGTSYWLQRIENVPAPAPAGPGTPKPEVRPEPVETPKAPVRPVEESLPPLRSDFGLQGVRPGAVVSERTRLTVYAPAEWDVEYVSVRVNGKAIYATNRAPFDCTWDPSNLEPGRYELTVRVVRRGQEPVVSPPLAVEVRKPQ